jgi:hypothetical protein
MERVMTSLQFVHTCITTGSASIACRMSSIAFDLRNNVGLIVMLHATGLLTLRFRHASHENALFFG